MAIKRSIEDLPSAAPREGRPPARNNFVAEALAQKWFDEYIARGEQHLGLAIPDAGPWRASWAGKRCDRDLFYALRGDEESNPNTIADYWRFGLGKKVHEMLQEVVEGLFPDAESELDIDLRPVGIPGSAHSDLVFTYKGKRTLVEIKTAGGFRFKMATTGMRGPAEGPSHGHVVQAAVAAAALGCEQVVICYLAMENLSPQMADFSDTEAGRFAAEWHFTTEALMPFVIEERDRVNAMLAHIEADTLPPRQLHDPTEVPVGAVVVDPLAPRNRGRWQLRDGEDIADHGETWICGYCNQRDRCARDGA